MVQSAIQLFTLRNVEKPVPELLEVVADAGFEGVEFYGPVEDADPEEVRATLAETGLEPLGTHVDIERLEEDPEEVATIYRDLGCEHLTAPYLPEEDFGTREAVEETAQRLDALADAVDDHGLSFHYHNHAHEFTDLGDTTGYEYLIERAETVGFQLDAGTALERGQDPADLVRRLGDRATLFHCKDYDVGNGDSAPVGRGDLDVEACAAATTEAGTEWFIYEYEGEDPLETLDEAADLINGVL